MAVLSKADIRRLFELLNEELRQADTVGELFFCRKRRCMRWKPAAAQAA